MVRDRCCPMGRDRGLYYRRPDTISPPRNAPFIKPIRVMNGGQGSPIQRLPLEVSALRSRLNRFEHPTNYEKLVPFPWNSRIDPTKKLLRFDLRLDDPSRRRRSSNRSNLSNQHSSGRKRARLTNAIIVHSPLDRGFGETITSGSVGKRERKKERKLKKARGPQSYSLNPRSPASNTTGSIPVPSLSQTPLP